MLEQTQRYVTRFALCFDKRSLKDSFTLDSGLPVDLLTNLNCFFRTAVNTTYKQLVNLHLGKILKDDYTETFLTYNLIETLAKYYILILLKT